jgi:hypothetical protein
MITVSRSMDIAPLRGFASACRCEADLRDRLCAGSGSAGVADSSGPSVEELDPAGADPAIAGQVKGLVGSSMSSDGRSITRTLSHAGAVDG